MATTPAVNNKRVIDNDVVREVERLCLKYIDGWQPYEYPSLAKLEGYGDDEDVQPVSTLPTFEF